MPRNIVTDNEIIKTANLNLERIVFNYVRAAVVYNFLIFFY